MLHRPLTLLLLALASVYAWAQAPLVLSPEMKRADLVPHLSILRDAGGAMGVAAAADSPDWHELQGAFNVGFTQDALWLRVTIERPADSPWEWILEVNNAVLDDVRLYRRTTAGAWEEHLAGEDIARDLWDLPYRNPVFRIGLAEPAQHTLWLRVSARNSISAQITLWRPAFFGEASRGESLAYGVLLGIYLTIIAIHLLFWRWTHSAVNGWYAIYVMNSFFHIALSFGFVQQYTGMPGRVSDMLLSLLICVSLWVGAKMSTGVLELTPRMPRTSRWLVRSMAVLSAMTGLLSLTVSYAAGVAPAQIVGVIEVAVLIAIAVRLWRQGYRPAAMFLAAFGLFCIGIVLRVARNFMLLPPNLFTENSFQISAIAHMVVMSLAIVYRYNSMMKAAERAKAETLLLKTKRAEALEHEVAARTLSLTTEIARREQLERDLRGSLEVEKQARQEQRDFVEMASHEFRTPLAIIDTSVQRIASSEPAPVTRERCGNIREATRRMIRLMDEFLSLDRVDGDLVTFTALDEDPAAVVQGAAAEWDRGCVVVACADLPARIACDAGLLRIALRNLLANAVRHSPEGVPVQFHTHGRADGGVDFAVADAGRGIPADELPQLFQKYFRGRGAQDQPGAGLGLYLVQRIANLHGGTVTVTSSSAGSRFILTVPGGSALGREQVTRNSRH
jgi:two-component system, sensor histidine kinase LadS